MKPSYKSIIRESLLQVTENILKMTDLKLCYGCKNESNKVIAASLFKIQLWEVMYTIQIVDQ